MFPYDLEVKTVKKDVGKFFELTWESHQTSPNKRQQKFLKQLATFLMDNPQISLDVYPIVYGQKEKEHILFYETKKKYFLQTHHKKEADFDYQDSVTVEQMSVKDLAHVLVKNLRKITRDTTMFTIHDRCNYFLDDDRVNQKYNKLLKSRELTFRSYFANTDVSGRVKIHSSKNVIPYNGFSCFKIQYNGDIPRSLVEAYNDMHDLNRGIWTKYF